MHSGVFGGPAWIELLIIGIIIVYTFYICGKILARTGRGPIWTLMLLVPGVQIIAFWLFAFSRWPRFNPKEDEE